MSVVSAVSREFSYFKFFLKLVGRSRSFDKKKYTTVADIMEEQVDKTPDNIACLLYTSPSQRDRG